MGSGKTTVGKLVSKRIRLDFVDTDHLIETDQNQSISDLFKTKGEPYFRELERQFCTTTLPQYENTVIATGGGMILDRDNSDALHKAGTVVYLSATPDTIFERLKPEMSTRPLLKDPQQIQSLLKQRQPTYESTADLMILTHSLSPDKVTSLVLDLLPNFRTSPEVF